VGDEEKFAEGCFGDFGEADKDPRIFAVVVSDVVGFGIFGEEAVAVVEGHAHDDRIALFAQADEQLSLHFQRGRAVGRAFSTFGSARPMRRTRS